MVANKSVVSVRIGARSFDALDRLAQIEGVGRSTMAARLLDDAIWRQCSRERVVSYMDLIDFQAHMDAALVDLENSLQDAISRSVAVTEGRTKRAVDGAAESVKESVRDASERVMEHADELHGSKGGFFRR